MTKPRVSWRYYPKLGRGYWQVSPLPKGGHLYNAEQQRLWAAAHTAVIKANVEMVTQ